MDKQSIWPAGRKFAVDNMYFSKEGGYSMYAVSRSEKSDTLRAEIGFGLPANYKIRRDSRGNEYIIAKGRAYVSTPNMIVPS